MSQAIQATFGADVTPFRSASPGPATANEPEKPSFQEAFGQAERRAIAPSRDLRSGQVSKVADKPHPASPKADEPKAGDPADSKAEATPKADEAKPAKGEAKSADAAEKKSPDPSDHEAAKDKQAPVAIDPTTAALQAALLAGTPKPALDSSVKQPTAADKTVQAVGVQVAQPAVADRMQVAAADQGNVKAQAKTVEVPKGAEALGKKDADVIASGVATQAADPKAGMENSSENASQGDSQKQDQGPKLPKPPVSPVVSQKVPQSIDSLRASQPLTKTSLKDEAPGGAVTMTPKETPKIAAAGELAQAQAIEPLKPDEPKVEGAVKPWELPHQIFQAPGSPHAQVIDQGTPKGEPVPLHEAMKTPFLQATSENRPSELRLQLSPENLGRMEIRVMAHEGTVSAQIRVDHADTKDMVQAQLAELRQSLADQGIKIDKLEVSVGQDDRQRQNQGFDLSGGMQQQMGQQQQQASQQADHHRRVNRYQANEASNPDAEDLETAPSRAGSGGTALVDYRA